LGALGLERRSKGPGRWAALLFAHYYNYIRGVKGEGGNYHSHKPKTFVAFHMRWLKINCSPASTTDMRDKEKTYGRVSLALKQAKNSIGFVEADIRDIARDLKGAASLIGEMRGAELDRPTVQEQISKLWVLVDRHTALVGEREEAETDMSALENSIM
jgi:hypothetical protein